jgi:hypothetical protein
MQSGLFGIDELTRGGPPDYLKQSISPIASRANSRAGFKKGTRGANLSELGPGPARILVQSLSTPEILHILNLWQVHHPSAVPLNICERAELVELAVQIPGPLSDIVRISGGSSRQTANNAPPEKCPPIKVAYNRGCTAGASVNLKEYELAWNSVQGSRKTVENESLSPSCSISPALPEISSSFKSSSPVGKGTVGGVGEKKSRRKREKSRGSGSNSVDPTVIARREKMDMLTREYDDIKSERKKLEIELARRGLLSLMFDSTLVAPVIRGRNREMVTVARNMEATSGFHNEVIEKW